MVFARMISRLHPEDARDRDAFRMALDSIAALRTGTLAQWLARVDHTDPFNQELIARYQPPHDAAIRLCSEHLLRLFMQCARRYFVRFMSLSRRELITFEDVNYDGWPVAWRIAHVLCDGTAAQPSVGNSHQIQIKLHDVMLPMHFGTYDLRVPECPVLIGQPAHLLGIQPVIAKVYKDRITLSHYLRACGVVPIRPMIRMPQLAAQTEFTPPVLDKPTVLDIAAMSD